MMEISREQVEAWRENPENTDFENFIGPHYKSQDGEIDLEALYAIVELNGLGDRRSRYRGSNTGQVVMYLRNSLRPLWLRGECKLPE